MHAIRKWRHNKVKGDNYASFILFNKMKRNYKVCSFTFLFEISFNSITNNKYLIFETKKISTTKMRDQFKHCDKHCDFVRWVLSLSCFLVFVFFFSFPVTFFYCDIFFMWLFYLWLFFFFYLDSKYARNRHRLKMKNFK